jgi:lysophospholipid acyltransferase (LPLAT)-like uncharacterized protein
MKLRHPTLIRGAAFAAAGLLKGWISTLRLRYDFRDGPHHPADPRRQRYLYAFWHEDILLSSCFNTKIEMLISQHADGELITQVAAFLGKKAVRGSSRRGGRAAMLELIRHCRDHQRTHFGITPDGPRGPRRRVQPGLIFLASKTGLPVAPLGIGYESVWRMKSWDQMAVPRPFSTAAVVMCAPIHVPANPGAAGLERYRLLVEERMRELSDDAERWATGQPRRPGISLAA